MPSVIERVRSLTRIVEEAPAFIHAIEGYGYGFPLVIMEVTRGVQTAVSRSGEYKAPMNQLHRMTQHVSPDFKDVVRISRSSLWSTGFIDLEEGPWVFSHPDTRGRYFVMQTMNMWTDNFVSVGSRTTGTGAGNFLIAGPNWNGTAPAEIRETFRCSTRYAWMLVQTAARGPDDFPEVIAIENEYKLTPLSAWGRPYSPPEEVPIDPSVDTTATPYEQLRLMDGVTFFKRLARFLVDNPPYPDDAPMLRNLKALGVEPGKDLDVDRLDPKVAEAMYCAAKVVWSLLDVAPTHMPTVNGWVFPLNLGRFGTDYSTRCVIAWLGLGALTADDAIYPTAFVDGDGRMLDGANKYVLHVEKDEIPRSHCGVWSISAYREHFYVHNPIERYAIASGMPLKYDADGSLDVYIQASSPGADKEANWLPCPPSGPFNVTIRAYWPHSSMLDGTWKAPPIRRA